MNAAIPLRRRFPRSFDLEGSDVKTLPRPVQRARFILLARDLRVVRSSMN